MTKHPPAWEWSDAWILGSIGPRRRGTDLRWLLRSADMLNHAIPTEAEVGQGLGRLVASGLVVHRGLRFAMTPAGKRLWGQVSGRQFEIVNSLFSSLKDVPMTEGTWPLHPADVPSARRLWMPWSRVRPGASNDR